MGIKVYRGPASVGSLNFFRLAGVGFERVMEALGPEEMERAVEDARYLEAQEREQKEAKRKFSRGAR